MLVTPFIVLESMGSLCSREQPYKESDAEGIAQAAEIDRRIAQETKAEHHIHKLLLLGAGESGKSTIFKQIKLLFQTGFDEAELRSYTSVIHANVYQTIKILFDGAEELAQNETESSKYVVSLDNKVIGEKLSEIGSRLGYPHLTKEIAQDIEALWNDAAIQETYARGNILQVPDCAQYFMENLERLSEVDYIPTKEDVLCSRVRTSGVAEIQFSHVGENRKSGEVYRLFDVGGQRNERRKWIHLFEGVTAVIFCAAISEYDQTLLEDDTKNRMMETKELFDWVLKQECFEKTSFMLFLNKFDIFEKKVQNVPLNVCEWFKDYQPMASGKQEVEHAYEFVKKKFEELYFQSTRPDRVDRAFKIYRTTALDQKLVKKTFKLVDETLRRRNLIEAGLISKRRDERFQENEDNREYLVPDIQRLYSLFDVALENNLVSLICHYITDICMDESAVSSDPILAFLLDEVVVKDWCKQTFKNIINDLHHIYSNPMEAMSSQVHLFQKIAFQLTGISNVLEVMNSSFKGTLSVQLEELHHLLENVLKAKQHLDVMTWCARHQFLEDIQSRYPNFTLWTLHVHERKSAALKRSWPETLNNLEDPAPNGSSLFIEQALSNLGIEQSYEEKSKEELDISCLLDRSSPRAFESLIDVADKNTEARCYPFETLRTATDILFLHGTSDMVVAKQAIFLYYIFDRHWTRLEVEWRHLIDDFAASFGLSRHLVLESLVFYLLDDHTDLSLQESIRILPEISGPETHPKIAQVLLERQCPDVALTVLRCTGRDNFCTRVNSEHEGLKCVSLGEAVTAVRVKIECGLLTEAFLYQRTRCSELKEQIAKHGSSLETSNKKNCNSWMHQVELLVTEICYLCIRRNLVDRMIELPWDSDEEKYIHKCLFEHASQDPFSVFGSLLVVFYLQRYRYIEAYQVDRKLRNMEETVSDTANVDVVSRMTSITQWRTRLVDNGLKLLPEAQSVKVTSGDMADCNLSSSQDAPMPYDVEFSNVPLFPATPLTPFSNSNEHLQLNGKAPSVLEHKLLTLGTLTTRKNSAVDGNSFSNIWNGEQSSAVNIVTRDVSREDARQGLDSAVFSLPVRHRSGSRNMPLKEFNKSSSKVPFSDGPIQVGKTLYGVESLNFVGQTENSLPFMRGVASEDANDMMDTSHTNGESIRDEKLVIPIRQNQPDRPRSKVLSDEAKNINSSWSLGQSNSPGMKSGLRWRSDESSDDDLGPPPNRRGSVAKTRRPRFSRR